MSENEKAFTVAHMMASYERGKWDLSVIMDGMLDDTADLPAEERVVLFTLFVRQCLANSARDIAGSLADKP